MVDLTTINWHSVLPMLGIDPKLIENPKRQGPCPICGGSTRFRLSNYRRQGNWICNGCGAGDGVKLISLLEDVSYKDALKKVMEHVDSGKVSPIRPYAFTKEKPRDVEKNRRTLQKTWDRAKPITPTDPAGKYLMRRLGFFDFSVLSSFLRFHPDLFHLDEGNLSAKSRHPALIARVIGVDGKPVSIHRTYLSHDGFKAAVSADQVKKLMSYTRSPAGDYIPLNVPRLDESGYDRHRSLIIVEGIEKGLGMVMATKNRRPVWSALNCGNLSKVTPSREHFDAVEIACDRDKLDVRRGWRPGEHYAEILRDRLVKMGFKVRIRVPPEEGVDWSDMWLRHSQKMGWAIAA